MLTGDEPDQTAFHRCETTLGGVLLDSNTCMFGAISSGSDAPACKLDCSKAAKLSDEWGECYEFMRLGHGGGKTIGYRETYRMTEKCARLFSDFESKCSVPCDSFVHKRREKDEMQSYVAPSDVSRKCHRNESEYTCGKAGCVWEDKTTSSEIKTTEVACDMVGGSYDSMHNTCSLPRCHPKVEQMDGKEEK